jgi:hypothetical protein
MRRVFTWLRVNALTIFILLSRSNNCSDPLDKIYGLYAVLAEQFEQLPAVDYSRDNNKVYEDFTWPLSSRPRSFGQLLWTSGSQNLNRVSLLGSQTWHQNMILITLP